MFGPHSTTLACVKKGHSIRVKFYECGSGSSASRRGMPQPAVNLGMQCTTCKLPPVHAIEQSLNSESRRTKTYK